VLDREAEENFLPVFPARRSNPSTRALNRFLTPLFDFSFTFVIFQTSPHYSDHHNQSGNRASKNNTEEELLRA